MQRFGGDEHQVGICQSLYRFLNANGLGFVQRVTNARRVDQSDGNAPDGNGFSD